MLRRSTKQKGGYNGLEKSRNLISGIAFRKSSFISTIPLWVKILHTRYSRLRRNCLSLLTCLETKAPINFNTDGMYFVSAAEEVGEEEAHP